MIALIAIMFFSMYRLNPNAPKTRELSQIEFFKAADDGKVVEPRRTSRAKSKPTSLTTRAIPSRRPTAFRSSPARTSR